MKSLLVAAAFAAGAGAPLAVTPARTEADLNWESKYLPALDELVEFERSLRPGR